MARTDVAYISGVSLAWARKRADLTVPELAAKFKNANVEQFVAWEEGRAFPLFSQAEKLASILRIPLPILFMDEPPQLHLRLPDLRTVGNLPVQKPSIDLLDVVNDSLVRKNWYHENQELSGGAAVPFVGRFTIASNFKTVANDMSAVLGVDDLRKNSVDWRQFLSGLVQRAEQAGILVMRTGVVRHATKRRLQVREFRGFAISDGFAPLVLINSTDAQAAQIFTLAHELAHIWIGVSGISNLNPLSPTSRSAVERFCNRVAAELLVPESAFEAVWNKQASLATNIRKIGFKFKVSGPVAIIRAYALRKISREQSKSLLRAAERQFEEQQAKTNSGGNFLNTFPARNSPTFMDAVITAVQSKRLLFREAARLLGTKVGVLNRYMWGHRQSEIRG